MWQFCRCVPSTYKIQMWSAIPNHSRLGNSALAEEVPSVFQAFEMWYIFCWRDSTTKIPAHRARSCNSVPYEIQILYPSWCQSIHRWDPGLLEGYRHDQLASFWQPLGMNWPPHQIAQNCKIARNNARGRVQKQLIWQQTSFILMLCVLFILCSCIYHIVKFLEIKTNFISHVCDMFMYLEKTF